jgi:RNA polymerase sigma-70 factor (ECF subfamily)
MASSPPLMDASVDPPAHGSLPDSEAASAELSASTPGPDPAATSGRSPLPEPFARLYEEHSRPVYYLALRLLGDGIQAEDATHDVFLKVWRNLDRFRGDADIRTWLYRITLNHCSNLRSSWHSRNVHTQPDTQVFDAAPAVGGNPFQNLALSELGTRIQTALDQISEEYRLLLLLVADEELSYQEVAELTGQSTDAVRGKLHRARKAFAVAFHRTE